MERWLPIDAFPSYEVSSNGRIRNSKSNKVLKPFSNQNGYSLVTLYEDGVPHTKKVHRLVTDAFYDGDNTGFQINHIDGDKTNNFIGNLERCTPSENIQHAYDTGLRKPPRTKSIMVVETGDVFESISDCARKINGTVSGIYDCITGRQNTHRGYHFKEVLNEL